MNYERYRDGNFGPLDYLVSVPSEPTEYDLSSVRAKLSEGHSLAGSVARHVVTHANQLMREEFTLFNDLPEEIAGKYLFVFPCVKWDLYTKPSLVILNSEALLGSGETYQAPEEDSEIVSEISNREFMASLFERILGYDFDVEAQITAIKADWQIRQELLLTRLLKNHPIKLLEDVASAEMKRFKYNDGDDVRSRDALQKGLDRFKRLYVAGEMMLGSS